MTSGLWSNKQLIRLIWPLIIDQLLITLLGIVDTAMVAALGDEAVGGVSLVDSINMLVILFFSALTTGGAVICSQYIGRGDNENASASAKLLVYLSTILSVALMAIAAPARVSLLRLIYGNLSSNVMASAESYMFFSALSYPFISIYSAGASIFRSMGDSKTCMFTSIFVNVLNVAGNALFIYGFGWGAGGAAVSTLVSRALAAVLTFTLLYLRRRRCVISIAGILRVRFDIGIIRSIMRVALPNGAENAMFQIGKLALARLVAVFGTAAIAGNAIGNIVVSIGNLPGMAIGTAMLTVIGQSVGAGEYDAASRYTGKLLKYSFIAVGSLNVLFALLMPWFLKLFALSDESASIAYICGMIFCCFAVFIWTPAYCLPYALRAAGDGGHTMLVAAFAMWVFRVGGAYVLAYTTGLGAISIWVSMVCEWVVRGAFYVTRWKNGKWLRKRLI